MNPRDVSEMVGQQAQQGQIPARAVSFRSGLPVGFFWTEHEKLKFQQISTSDYFFPYFSAFPAYFGIFWRPFSEQPDFSGPSPPFFKPMPPKNVPQQEGQKATPQNTTSSADVHDNQIGRAHV